LNLKKTTQVRVFFYILFLVISLSSFYVLKYFHEGEKPVSLLTEATRPDNLLLNSRTHLREESMERSHSNLTGAIKKLESIKADADSMSRKHIQTSLNDLYRALELMESGKLEVDELNTASILTLNALTYYQIKSAEDFIRNNEFGKAKVALEYGKSHVKNALIFADGDKKNHEIRIYTEMDAIIGDESLNKSQRIKKLEEILDELEDLEVAYH